MATVRGLTAERMLEIEAASVVDGEVDANGQLVLTKHGGEQIVAGSVVGPPGSDATVPAEERVHWYAYGTEPYTDLSPLSAYPSGMTIFAIGDNVGTTWPEGIATIETFKVSSVRGFQRLTGKHRKLGTLTFPGPIWERSVTDNDAWTPWQECTPETRLNQADFTNATPPSSYPLGKSVMYVDGARSLAGNWGYLGVQTPSGRWGIIETHRYWDGSISDAYQTWRRVHSPGTVPTEMWIRGGNAGGWGEWYPVKIAGGDSDNILVGRSGLAMSTWYRIADLPGTNGGSGERVMAKFTLTNETSGMHDCLIFYAGVAYQGNSAIDLVSYVTYSSNGISAVRIAKKGDPTYGGSAVDIRTNHPSTRNPVWTVKIEHVDWREFWRPINFVDASAETISDVQVGVIPTTSRFYPTLLNGWSNYDTVYERAAYEMRAGSLVQLSGLIKNGTVGPAAAFILPPGCRPSLRRLYTTTTSTGIGRIDITPAGEVFCYGGGNGFFSLDGITFTAYQ